MFTLAICSCLVSAVNCVVCSATIYKLLWFIYVRFNYNILLLLPPWLIGPKTLNSVVTSVIHPSFLQTIFWTILSLNPYGAHCIHFNQYVLLKCFVSVFSWVDHNTHYFKDWWNINTAWPLNLIDSPFDS